MGFRKTLEWIAIPLMDFKMSFENKVFKLRKKEVVDLRKGHCV
jgi:hypothetical protein